MSRVLLLSAPTVLAIPRRSAFLTDFAAIGTLTASRCFAPLHYSENVSPRVIRPCVPGFFLGPSCGCGDDGTLITDGTACDISNTKA